MASTEINKISSNNVVGSFESKENSNNSIIYSKPYPNDSFTKSSDNNQKSEAPEKSFFEKH
jgi:hypothetical protein